MALDVLGTCAVADDGITVPDLSLGLTFAFAAYILLDSIVAFSVIVRKCAEAENYSRCPK